MESVDQCCYAAALLEIDPRIEIAFVKFKRYKSPGSVQIAAKLFKAGVKILLSEIYKFINCIRNLE
jgi:hypothetical protein